MNLYIIRHAIAVEAGTPGYEDDSQRPLTGKGKKKMETVAEGLKNQDVQIDVMLTSPYVRAADTAKIVRKAFGLNKDQVIETEHLMPNGQMEQLINFINEQYASVANLALVGHEPYLSSLIATLVAGNTDVNFDLKKGGVCLLSAEKLQFGRCATLEWFLAPAQLAQLGD